MFKVQVVNNLSSVFNKIDMLNINIQSAAAEAAIAAEPEIRDLFDSNNNESDIEISPTSGGVEIVVKNCYYDISDEARQIVINKLKSKFGGN